MEQPVAVELTLEQQFNLERFSDSVEAMTPSQAKHNLIELYRLYLQRENLHKEALKIQWGIGQ